MESDPICQALPLARFVARNFEGFYSRPYLDPVGVPTIGYGTTLYPNGCAVTLRDPSLTESQAAALLESGLRSRAICILQMSPGLAAGRLAALTDFSYNLGMGRLRASTMFTYALAGRWALVPAELRKWVHAGGRILPGLVKRREAEILLI